MSIYELLILAVGLSMDAFAVSICKGLAMEKLKWRNAALVGLWFGGFQAGMPLLGFFLGTIFCSFITSVDHWVAFILLGLIGVNMIRESLEKDSDADDEASRQKMGSLGVGPMFLMAVATSIDALAVGITFALLDVKVVEAVSVIGVTTFLFSVVGVLIGHIFGSRYKSKAEMTGGVILILLGFKILISGLTGGA